MKIRRKTKDETMSVARVAAEKKEKKERKGLFTTTKLFFFSISIFFSFSRFFSDIKLENMFIY
jgi:hypothetical protein